MFSHASDLLYVILTIDDIRRFLSGVGNEPGLTEPEMIPLVSNNNDDDDEPLLYLETESPSSQNISAADSIGFRLQSILYHFVAEPVIKGRVVIFVIYIVIFILSAFLVSKLKVFDVFSWTNVL